MNFKNIISKNISSLALDPVVNFGKVTVSTGYTTETTITLNSGEGAKLPDPSVDGSFNLVWYNSSDYPDPSDDPNVEIVRCIARSTDTLVIMRNEEGTSSSNKNTPGKTYKMILAPTKKMLTDIPLDAQSKIDTHAILTSTHGVAGNIVGTTDIQTIINKIINADNNTISNIDFETAIKQSTFQNQSFQNLIKNGSFENWSAGATAPDNWTLFAGVTATRESTNVLYGTYSMALTYVSSQSPYSGVYTTVTPFNIAYFANKKYTFGCWTKTSIANQARIGLRDNVNQIMSPYHSGSGNWEFLTVTTTIDPTGNGLFPIITMNTTGTAYFDRAILVEGSIVPAFSEHPNKVLDEKRFKIGQFSRDMTLPSGTQSIITDFKPTTVIFFAVRDAGSEASWGFDDGEGAAVCMRDRHNISPNTYDTSPYSIFLYESSTAYYFGKITSKESNGFTVTWTRYGAKSGTALIQYMAIR